jgi:preprotein translocase SecE subunit
VSVAQSAIGNPETGNRMALTIYKSGQGYWTRMLSAVGAGVLVLGGVAWLWNALSRVQGDNRIYIQAGVAAAIILGFGILLFWILNKPSVVDFMIATEAEMRKVNWPSRREIIASTWVVILGTAFLAVILLLIDLFFTWFFMKIDVLAPGA